MTIKAILFDKDGTLLDFEATFAPATAKVLTALANGDDQRLSQMANAVEFDLESGSIGAGSVLIAGSLENIADCLLPHTGHADLAACLAHIDELYVLHSLASLTAFPFMENALDELAAMGLVLGVATNDSEEAAHAHLDQLGITERFAFVAGFDSGYGEKPGPGMVSAFIDHLGLAPDQVMMVGDSPHDCKAGRAASAIAVGVTSGGRPASELEPEADHVIGSIELLPQLVVQLADPK
ncbi:MAG: HAD family hydrolase [Rhizobiaceae bacterium]